MGKRAQPWGWRWGREDTGQVLCGLEEKRGPDLSGAEGRTQLYPES